MNDPAARKRATRPRWYRHHQYHLPILILVVLPLLGSSLLISCSRDRTQDPTNTLEKISTKEIPTISFLTTWSLEDAKGIYFLPLLEAFSEEQQEKMVLETETFKNDQMVTEILIRLSSERLPDIFTYWGGRTRMDSLIQSGQLLNVREYLETSDSVEFDDFLPYSWEIFRKAPDSDHYFGIPMEQYQSAFICNADIFEQYGIAYPKTFDDLAAIAPLLRQQGIIPFAMSSYEGNPAHFWFSELCNQFPGGLEEIEHLGTTRQFDTATTRAVAALVPWMKEQEIIPIDSVSQGSWEVSMALYNEERAAMIYTFTWMLSTMDERLQERSVVIDVPRIVDPGATVSPTEFISGGSIYGLLLSDRAFHDRLKQQALTSLADMILSEPTFKALMRGGLIPARSGMDLLELYQPIVRKSIEFYADHRRTTSHFFTLGNQRSLNVFKESMDKLYAGLFSPEEFIEQVQHAVALGTTPSPLQPPSP